MKRAVPIAYLTAVTCALYAQTHAKPTLESSLADGACAFTIPDGKLAAAGAAVLEAAIAHADFVLLGEDHLSREIPRFYDHP